MICPVRLASDLSALRAAKVGDHGQHDLLHEGRDGAGDESTRSDFAGHGQEDYVVAGGGDYWNQRPADAALAGGGRGGWLARIILPAAREAVAQAGVVGHAGTGTGAVSRAVLRFERAALSREAHRRASD